MEINKESCELKRLREQVDYLDLEAKSGSLSVLEIISRRDSKS